MGAVDRRSLRIGLYGFNGIFVGAALPTFLTPTPMLWVYIVVGAMVSVIAMSRRLPRSFKHRNVPALTFPFVLTTWFLVLGAYAFPGVRITSLGPPALPQVTAAASAPFLDPTFLINRPALTGSPGLFDSEYRHRRHLYCCVGSRFVARGLVCRHRFAVALITIWVLGGDTGSVATGLFGFSAVLTAITLGATFYPFSPRTVFSHRDRNHLYGHRAGGA